MKTIKNSLVLQVLLLVLITTPLYAYEGPVKGRISLSDYFSVDSNDSELHVFSTKARIYMTESDESPWFFNFNGRVRSKMLNGDLDNDSPETQIRELWIGYRFPNDKFKTIAGRQYIEEMYNSYVDGLNLKYKVRDDITLGIFGGLTPDKYDSTFNAEFQTIGIYTDVAKEWYNIKAGYEHLRYKGETDREYASLKVDADLRDDLKFNSTAVASRNQITDDIDLENLNMNFRYKYSKDLRLNFFYNYYRAVKLYASAKDYFNIDFYDDYFYEFNSLARAGLKANYRLTEKVKLSGSVVYQRRGTDDAEAMRYTGGINRSDLYGFDLSGRYTHVDNFDSTEDEFRVEVMKRLMEKFDVSVYVTQELEEVDSAGGFSNDTMTYGSSLYWKINKSYDFFIFVERYDEKDYHNTSVFAKVGFRF